MPSMPSTSSCQDFGEGMPSEGNKESVQGAEGEYKGENKLRTED